MALRLVCEESGPTLIVSLCGSCASNDGDIASLGYLVQCIPYLFEFEPPSRQSQQTRASHSKVLRLRLIIALHIHTAVVGEPISYILFTSFCADCGIAMVHTDVITLCDNVSYSHHV